MFFIYIHLLWPFLELQEVTGKKTTENNGNEIMEIFGDGNNSTSHYIKAAQPQTQMLKSQIEEKIPRPKNPLEPRINAVSLSILFLPFLLYYVVER
jgi:hypothetical protein